MTSSSEKNSFILQIRMERKYKGTKTKRMFSKDSSKQNLGSITVFMSTWTTCVSDYDIKEEM
jgi:hypothetical protein